MATQRVHIRYRRSGGFAGIELAAEAGSDELPDEQADAARSLLAAPPGSSASAAPGADRFNYELHLDDGTHQQTFHWTDADVPEQARSLMSSLNRMAHPV